jgi:hypothetical protein
MLGRRAVVGASIVAFAVTGGGIAMAATHGSSHASTPKVRHVTRQHPGLRQYHVQLGHCHHDGAAPAAADV